MANEWSIIRPQAATNLITNPSVETATTGYSATSTGTTIAAGTTYVRRGYRSLTITPTSSTGEGAYFGTITMTSGTSYTASVDVLGVAAIPYNLYIGDTSGTAKATTSITGSGYWKRQTVTWACDGTASYRVYLCKGASASTAAYYLDGLQVEATAYATTYIDGDQTGTADGYKWTGTPNASTSTRSAQERAGGREYFLDTDITTRILLFDGVGVAPLEVFSEQRALLPGAEFQGTRTLPREMTLVIQTGSTSAAGFHSQRKDLIDLVKPDIVSPEQPFVLRYYGANTSTDAIEISVVYAGGLELNSPTSYRVDKVAMRLVAFDPYWKEAGNQSTTLDGYGTGTFYYIAGRLKSTGAWSDLGLTQVPTANGIIYAIASNPSNRDEIFVGGNFTGLDGVAGRDMLAKYTISTNTWATVGSTGGVNGAVRALCFAPDGTLYFGGAFTNVGDAAGDYLAKWTSGGGLAAVSAGGTGSVYALVYTPDSKLIIGGDFDNWNAIAEADNLVTWDGSAYAAPWSAGADDTVSALAIFRRASIYSLYIGGIFANIGGTAADGVAVTSTLTTFWETGGGAGGFDFAGEDASSLAITPDYTIYAGNKGASGGIYRLVGQAFDDLPDTIIKTVRTLKYDEQKKLLYIGATAGAVAGQIPIRTFNGTSGGTVDLYFDPADTASVYAIESYDDNLFIGMDDDYTIAYPGGVTSITNSGTAESYPVVRIKRSGGTSATLKSIRNETTGVVIEFEDYAIQDGEEITLDFRLTNRSIKSSVSGSIWQAVKRNSDFAKFSLLPGVNKVSCLVTEVDIPTMTISFRWQTMHWSIDGVAA